MKEKLGLQDVTAPIGGQLINALREQIVTGRLVPGARVSEQEIATQFGISRQPVREAFIRLGGEGLVEVRPQRGTYVCKINLERVEISRFVREAVESDLVKLAAEKADGALIRELEAQLDAQSRLPDGSGLEFMRLDEHFHRTIAEAAGRGGAWVHLQPIKMHMDRVRHLTAVEFPLGRLITQHRAIVTAIAENNQNSAESAMRLHLRNIFDDLPKIAAAQPHYFEAGTN